METSRLQSGSPVICYITEADNSVVQVEVEHRARGQEVLDKICRMLGILEEAEYFGIQYLGGKNELLWVNNRNKLSRQISTQPPYHLYFKVKFFVPPEDLLLEGTRLQFYNNVVHQLKDGMWDSDTTLTTQARLIALMAYVQFGKYNQNTTPCKYACFWPDSRGEIPAEVIRMAANFHRNLEAYTVSQAQYELLRTVHTDVPCYGTYFYEVKDIFERRYVLGVGPENIILCNANLSISDKFPYCRVHTVTTSSRVVTLNLLEDDGSVKGRNYQLASPRLASALYRAVTELYAFFRCDSVRKEVLLQTRRDLRDAISFHHNGREYAFDVRFTFREVYDRARRRLYYCTTNTHGGSVSGNLSDTSCTSAASSSALGLKAAGDSSTGNQKDLSSRSTSLNIDEDLIQELVQKCLAEISLCRVCMDAPVSRVFIPCGHIICCPDCADRIEECSICRKQIEVRQPCFLPWNTESAIENHIQLTSRRRRRQSERCEVATTSDSLLPHTASAPTCELFSLNSPTCSHPISGETPAKSGGYGSEPSTSENVALNVASPVTRASSTVSVSSSSDQRASQELSASCSLPAEALPTPSDGARDDIHGNVRRPVHVTWQLSNDD